MHTVKTAFSAWLLLSLLVCGAAAQGTFPGVLQPGQVIGNNGTSPGIGAPVGPNIGWRGDQYFGSGRPWCDVLAENAQGDGSTDDTFAFNACISAVAFSGFGGTVYIPTPSSGTFCIKNGPLEVPDGVVLVGESMEINLSSCGSGNGVIKLDGTAARLSNLTLNGPGMDGQTSFGATASTLQLTANCVECVLRDLLIEGGLHAVLWNSNESQAFNVHMHNAFGSVVLIQGSPSKAAGGEFVRASTDGNPFPYAMPVAGTSYGTWSTNQTITSGKIVSATCQDGNSYYIQAGSNGTTAASGIGPTCANFGTSFPDGTVTWQLMYRVGSYKWQIDSYTQDVHIAIADTGGMDAGIGLTNTLSGTIPQGFSCTDCNGGSGYNGSLYGVVGQNVTLVSPRFASCISPSCAVINITSTFTGGVSISGGNLSNSRVGIAIAGGSNYRIRGVDFTGPGVSSGVDAIAISGSASQIVAQGNNIPAYATGISISGTASDIVFTGNTGCVNGDTTCVSNSSSGANVITTPNDDGVAYAVKPGATVITGGGNGKVEYNNSGVLGETSMRQMVGGGTAGSSLTAGLTEYQCTFNLGAEPVGCLLPFSGTFKNFYFETANGPGAGQTVVLTLYVGTYNSMSATSVTCTLTGAGTGAGVNSCNDTTHTATFSAGQQWAIQSVVSGSATASAGLSYGIEADNP